MLCLRAKNRDGLADGKSTYQSFIIEESKVTGDQSVGYLRKGSSDK